MAHRDPRTGQAETGCVVIRGIQPLHGSGHGPGPGNQLVEVRHSQAGGRDELRFRVPRSSRRRWAPPMGGRGLHLGRRRGGGDGAGDGAGLFFPTNEGRGAAEVSVPGADRGVRGVAGAGRLGGAGRLAGAASDGGAPGATGGGLAAVWGSGGDQGRAVRSRTESVVP